MPQHKKNQYFHNYYITLKFGNSCNGNTCGVVQVPSTLSLNWLVSMEKQVITVVLKVINSFVMVFFILNCLLLLHCTMCIAKWFAFYLWNFNKIWSKFSNVIFLLFN